MFPLPRHAIGLVLRRICAGGSAALVLAMAVFAVSPNAHAWVHDDDGHDKRPVHHDDNCAVVLFASGVSWPLDHALLSLPQATALSQPPPAPDELLLTSPRYLRRPERGPPASRVS